MKQQHPQHHQQPGLGYIPFAIRVVHFDRDDVDEVVPRGLR